MKHVSLALLLSLAVAAPAAAEFGPSETGCPAFWAGETEPGSTDLPDVDVSGPGPFGTANLHVTGLGLSTDGTSLTATVRSMNMTRQVMPGFTKSGWEFLFTGRRGAINLGTLRLIAAYELATDTFGFYAKRSGNYVPATGAVTLGPNGGVTITAKLADLGMKVGDRILGAHALSYGLIHYFYMTDPVTGIFVYRSDVKAPDTLAAIPCPGVSMSAFDMGGGQGVAIDGVALPLEGGQEIAIERQEGDTWTQVASTTTDEVGGFIVDLPVSPGPVTLRATVRSRYEGSGVGAPVTVTAS